MIRKSYAAIALPLFLAIMPCIMLAGNSEIDSLKNALSKKTEIISRAEIMSRISILYKNVNADSAIYYNNMALEIATDSGDRQLLAGVLVNRSIIFNLLGDYEKAVNYALEAAEYAKEGGSKQQETECYSTIGHIYYHKAENENFRNGEDLVNARDYYVKAIEIAQEQNDSLWIVNNWIEIGLVRFQMGESGEAIRFLNNALNVSKRHSDEQEFFHNIAKASHNIALVFASQKRYNEAAINFRKAAEIDSILGNKEGVALIRLAEIYLETGHINEAVRLAQNSFDTAVAYNFKLRAKQAAEVLQKAYAIQGKYQEAYKSLQQFQIFSDSLYSEEFIKKLGNLELKHQFEMDERERELVYNAEIQRQKIIRNASIAGMVLALLLIFVIFRSYLQKRKANKLLQLKNAQIMQQKEEIEAQRDLAAQQRDLIAGQKQEITDSIEYAFRIQAAVIPDESLVSAILTEYFIFYKPRDIVSGDFYWIGRIQGKVVIIAADCTGHGVPGAFMSMLGVAFLNEIVNKEQISDPGKILNRLRQEIIRALKQHGRAEGEVNLKDMKDGMDVAAMTIDPEGKTVLFSGANNPLYLIRNDELVETKGNKMPVAIHQNMDDFTCHEFSVLKGDILYVFSDGFPDQFGGPNGKKFKYAPFKELLVGMKDKPMNEQKEILEKTFTTWMEGYEQIDDVMVIGVKI